MKHEHAIVVDAKGYKVEFVLVHIDEETGQESIDSYKLQAGESLVYSGIPLALGMLRPCWDGSAWAEVATDEELAAARPEPEAPKSDPRDLAIAELTIVLAQTQQAIAELSIFVSGGES